jgi:hypothetical protein
MTRLSSAFPADRAALVTFITAGDDYMVVLIVAEAWGTKI